MRGAVWVCVLLGCSRPVPIVAEADAPTAAISASASAALAPPIVSEEPVASVIPSASASVAKVCVRSCGKSECGPDGCGGSCGDCSMKGRFFVCEKDYDGRRYCRDRSHCLECSGKKPQF
jgi:hypothetical protein